MLHVSQKKTCCVLGSPLEMTAEQMFGIFWVNKKKKLIVIDWHALVLAMHLHC